MTLQVSFEEFAETVKRVLGGKEAYVAPQETGAVATAGCAEKAIVVAAISLNPPDQAAEALKASGLKVFNGTWLTGEEILAHLGIQTDTFVAAVAYKSGDDKAGVWIDAYPELPTQMTVLKTMYDEFRETGEMDDVLFEEFIQLANPNVVIVSPSQLQSFLKQKQDC